MAPFNIVQARQERQINAITDQRNFIMELDKCSEKLDIKYDPMYNAFKQCYRIISLLAFDNLMTDVREIKYRLWPENKMIDVEDGEPAKGSYDNNKEIYYYVKSDRIIIIMLSFQTNLIFMKLFMLMLCELLS